MGVGVEALFTGALGLLLPWVVEGVKFATEGRDHQTVLGFAADLKAHGNDPAEVRHVCMDMSAAYAKGAALALPAAAINYDRFHVISMAIQAMDDVRREELRTAQPGQEKNLASL